MRDPRGVSTPLIPAHSASLRAFTPAFDGLWTRVNALMAGIYDFVSRASEARPGTPRPDRRLLGPRLRGDERKSVS
jgi:hypothetical protein